MDSCTMSAWPAGLEFCKGLAPPRSGGSQPPPPRWAVFVCGHLSLESHWARDSPQVPFPQEPESPAAFAGGLSWQPHGHKPMLNRRRRSHQAGLPSPKECIRRVLWAMFWCRHLINSKRDPKYNDFRQHSITLYFYIILRLYYSNQLVIKFSTKSPYEM